MKHTPYWIDKKINIRKTNNIKSILHSLSVNTICTEALCPNISECYQKHQATFMILGTICTRSCRFCNVVKGKPGMPDNSEPERIVQAVQRLGLKHVIITSPTRDDLNDGGASIFARTVSLLKNLDHPPTIEILIPDFYGNIQAVNKVVASKPDIISHNMETVRRLYELRTGADYNRSLNILSHIKNINTSIAIKSAVMLGLSETEPEIIELMNDLLDAGCRYLSIGQYLSPSKHNHPVIKYVTPESFEKYRDTAIDMGFIHVESGPYVRSSYHGENYLAHPIFHPDTR
ncbi:MAG: lipoyl synthase [Elusimicrobiota bacterium]